MADRFDTRVRKRIVARVYPSMKGHEDLGHQLWAYVEPAIMAVHASIVEPLLVNAWRRTGPVDRHDYIWRVING